MKKKSTKRKFRPLVVLCVVIGLLPFMFFLLRYTNNDVYNWIVYGRAESSHSEWLIRQVIAKQLNTTLYELNADDLKNVKALRLEDPKIKDINYIKKLKNLRSLSLGRLTISNINPVAKLKKLKTLSISSMKPRKKEYSKWLIYMRKLFGLSSKNTSPKEPIISLKPLKKLNDLQELTLSCEIKDLKYLKNLKNLKELKLWDKPLDDIQNLSVLTQLKYLNISGTQVSDIEPLQNMKNLEQLDLSFTPISDISALENLYNLKEFCISSTTVNDISPLFELKNLKYLNCSYSSISDEQLAELQKALPDLKIVK